MFVLGENTCGTWGPDSVKIINSQMMLECPEIILFRVCGFDMVVDEVASQNI